MNQSIFLQICQVTRAALFLLAPSILGCSDPEPIASLCPDNGIVQGNVLIQEASELASLEGCTEIDGDLEINGPSIVTLEQLDALQTISGDVKIMETELENLNGLDNLQSVGHLGLYYNHSLKDLVGIETLEHLNSLSIAENNNLISLKGLSCPAELTGNLWIDGNLMLETLSELENLQTVAAGVHIYRNSALMSLEGLRNLTDAQEVRIADNPSLTSLKGLDALANVELGLFVQSNSALTRLTDFPNLTYLTDLYVEKNTSLETLEGLEALSKVERLYLDANSKLAHLDGLSGITEISFSIHIEKHNALTRIDGLRNAALTAEEAIITLNRNPRLGSLAGLEKITARKHLDVLSLMGNSALSDLTGINPELRSVLILYITGTNHLINLDALSQLETVSDLRISDNARLASLSGLSRLNPGGATLHIQKNPLLTDLAGLEGVSNVGRELLIDDNVALADLSALQNLATVGRLAIYNNPALTTLADFSKVTEVYSLEVVNNDSLQTLAGLESLVRIEGWVVNEWADEKDWNTLLVSGNAALQTLSALSSVNYAAYPLEIYDNPILPSCEVDALAERAGTTCENCDGNDVDGVCL